MIKPIAILQGIALINAMILLFGSTMVYWQHYLYTPYNRFDIGIHLGKRNRKYLRFSQKYNINAFFIKVQLARYLPHTTLCPIAPYSISILFSRNKSNTAAGRLRATAFFWWNYKRDVRCMNTPTTWKEIRNICAGFNDIQRKTLYLHAKMLTALGATSSQHSTTTRGSHTSTETVSLSTLTLIRLISALHF